MGVARLQGLPDWKGYQDIGRSVLGDGSWFRGAGEDKVRAGPRDGTV